MSLWPIRFRLATVDAAPQAVLAPTPPASWLAARRPTIRSQVERSAPALVAAAFRVACCSSLTRTRMIRSLRSDGGFLRFGGVRRLVFVMTVSCRHNVPTSSPT